MSGPATVVTPLGSFRNETPYPFCPGCGHGPILDHLNKALALRGLDPHEVVLVTDIGCSGLSDQYFSTNAFHGLHGRSLTYATGVKLARPELTVIVIMGDGGTGIGGAHFLSAARRNIGLTLIVFNNMNFGMTGGQHSSTTPVGAATATTPGGNLERPLDICATAAANGASFVYRGTTFDKDLGERIAEATTSGGFAVLDVWELCTAYFVPKNHLTRASLDETMDSLKLRRGLIHREERPEYATAYRSFAEAERGKPKRISKPLVPAFTTPLAHRAPVVVAGSAGGKVRSAAKLFAEAAILSGLRVAQRDDYPITVKSGHSVSELILSPTEIHDTGITKPEVLVILSDEGRKKCGRYLAAMAPTDTVFALPGVGALATKARIVEIDPSRGPLRPTPTTTALIVLAAVLAHSALYPREALLEAARTRTGSCADESLRAIEAGFHLADAFPH